MKTSHWGCSLRWMVMDDLTLSPPFLADRCSPSLDLCFPWQKWKQGGGFLCKLPVFFPKGISLCSNFLSCTNAFYAICAWEESRVGMGMKQKIAGLIGSWVNHKLSWIGRFACKLVCGPTSPHWKGPQLKVYKDCARQPKAAECRSVLFAAFVGTTYVCSERLSLWEQVRTHIPGTSLGPRSFTGLLAFLSPQFDWSLSFHRHHRKHLWGSQTPFPSPACCLVSFLWEASRGCLALLLLASLSTRLVQLFEQWALFASATTHTCALLLHQLIHLNWLVKKSPVQILFLTPLEAVCVCVGGVVQTL